MTRILGLLFIVLVLMWTGFAWLLARLLASGGTAVVRISDWLSIDPAKTQWLAELLDTVGVAGQIAVWAGWAIGTLALTTGGWLLWRAARGAVFLDLSQGGPGAYRGGPADVPGGHTLEGEVTGRSVTRNRGDQS